MQFVDFAAQHGLLIDCLEVGRWTRVPTEDHPRTKNGAYIFKGDHGFVQNHATMERPVVWSSNGRPAKQIVEQVRAASRDIDQDRKRAAEKAAGIVRAASRETHPYLARKGFPAKRASVWNGLLVVPMRIGDCLVGAQLIGADGTKKFLRGQQCSGASCAIGSDGPEIVVEGLATGLSVRRALAGVPHRIVVAFSAGNMATLLRSRPMLAVADGDPAGKRAASGATGVWVAPDGQDANDVEMEQGTPVLARALRALLAENQ